MQGPGKAGHVAPDQHSTPQWGLWVARTPRRNGGQNQGSRTMAEEAHLRVLNNPRFQELVRRRSGFAWTLSVIMLAIYFGFILLVAFAKPLLAMKVGGGVTSLGIVLGLVVIVVAFLLTGLYVRRANGEFDALTARLREEVQ